MGPLPFYLLAVSLVYNAPLLALLWLARERLSTTAPRFVAAIGFALATGYTLWRLEWEDVWRHGIPSPGYLMVFLAYLIVAAVVGWGIGRVVAPPRSV
jgi:hypothetical protein